MPVIAANVPRFLAAHVAKNNASTEGVEAQYQQWLPKHTYDPEGAYKDKFYAQMSSPAAPMKMPPQRLAAVYAAQCLKDDKMAESIAAFVDAHQNMQILHINGCFHSDAHLGTAQKLEALRPELKVAVITPLERKQKGEKPAGILSCGSTENKFFRYFFIHGLAVADLVGVKYTIKKQVEKRGAL